MKIEAFDVETININGRLKPIVIAFTNKTVTYSKYDNSWNSGEILTNFFIDNLRKNSIYYAHNLTFDLLIILPHLTKKKFEFKTTITNYSIYELKLIKNSEIYCTFRCSYKLSGLSLNDLGNLIGVIKFPFPIKLLTSKFKKMKRIAYYHFYIKKNYLDFIFHFKRFKDERTEKFDMISIIETYCARDAEIAKLGVKRIFNNLPKTINKNNILSASGMSLQLALQFTKKINLNLPENIDLLIRKAYYGGRCEVYGNAFSDESVLHFDFKGMYAQCMKESLPHGHYFINKHINDTQVPGFYLIEFEQNLNMPILPVRIDEKLNFFNGKLSGWYWFEEINYAVSYGVILIKIKASITFENYDPILNDFVEYNNTIREKDSINNIIGKNNNNMLYGRLGMSKRRDIYEIVHFDDKSHYDCAWAFNNFKIIKNSNITNKGLTNVALAGSITAKARIKLYQGFKIIEKNGGRMLYTDTDSLVCSFKTNQLGCVINRDLGFGIKFEESRIGVFLKDSVFALPKAYSIKYEKKR